MKLQKYTPQSYGRKSQFASLQLNVNTGVMRFNSLAVALLDLTDGEHIQFAQDEETHQWYVALDKKGPLKVRIHSDQSSFCCNSVDQVKQIHLSVEDTKRQAAEWTSFGVMLGTECVKHDGLKYYELILASAEPGRRKLNQSNPK